ncbi:hypothetical protein TURU_056033 [Turdus rufiventris]|nr:hypothetical protein TURU_056033 [Turdus rufiventris]
MEPPVAPQEQPPRPRSHTVTTTSSSFTANLSASSSTLAYDREFLRTVPGLLMVTEIITDYMDNVHKQEDDPENWCKCSPDELMGTKSD